MIYIEPEHRITITLTNSDGNNDIANFCSVVSKCHKESKKAGFRNMFTSKERDILESLIDNLGLNKEQPANGFVDIKADYIKVRE